MLAAANSILLTRLLGRTGRGEFAIFTAAAALASLVLSFGTEFALSYLLARGRLDRQRVLPSIAAFASSVAGAFLLLLVANDRLLGNAWLLPEARHDLPFELLLSLLVLATLTASLMRAAFQGSRAFHSLNALDMLTAVSSALVYAGLFSLARSQRMVLTPGAILVVYVSLAAASAAALAVVGKSRLGLSWSWRLLDGAEGRTLFLLGRTAYAGTLLQFLNYRFDYWLVRHFTDVPSLGVYSLASTLAQMLWLLPRSAAGVFFPSIASGNVEAPERQLVVGRLALLASATIAVAGAATSGWWLPLLYGETFRPATPVFGVLLAGAVPYAGTIIWASALAGKGLQRENALASFWGFVATIVLDVTLIPRFGLLGAAVASSLSYAVTTLFVARRLTKVLSVPAAALFVPRRSDVSAIWNVGRGLLRRLR